MKSFTVLFALSLTSYGETILPFFSCGKLGSIFIETKGVLRSILRSLRVLLLTILITLSLPVLRCDAEKTISPAAGVPAGGASPRLNVEVRLQSVSQPSLLPTETPTPVPTATPSPTPTPTPTPGPTPFSLYWVSDTPVYAYRYPKVFNKIFAYMANSYVEQNALGVVMTGDIVDNRTEQRHWDHAKSAIGLLEGKLPLWSVAGNHDVGADKADYKTYLSYGFCAAEEGDMLYKDGVCWYDTFTAAGEDFLLLGIGWQNDSNYLPWVRAVLDTYPDRKTIILVHSFLTDRGGLTGTGKNLERELLSVYPGICLVLCGHNDGSVRWHKEYEDGHGVNALLYNFQDDKKYGLGYLRILTFDPADRSLHVTTYSPWFDDYNYFKDETKDTFTLENAW